MSGIDTLPNIPHRNGGKFTEDPIKNLPQFADKRVKQPFSEPSTKVDVQIDPNQNSIGVESYDLVREINARKFEKEVFSFRFFWLVTYLFET